jgi:S1-C subfamily serine protease/antitoxin component YwqK of YwqJK toxin-antitoxin module
MKNGFLFFLLSFFSLSSFCQTLKDEWVVCNNQGCKALDPYYSEGVKFKWEGACLNGKANGTGKMMKYKNGELESTYEGEYKNGIREGKGKFKHNSGTVLECSFKNGQAIGFGKYDLADGNYYQGEIVNYRQHGYGVLTYGNGSKFEGFFVSDYPYTGKHTSFNGAVSYIEKYNPTDKIKEEKTGYAPAIGVRVTEYFDKSWKRCKQKDAAFYRLVTYESDHKPKGVVKDFYISGQLQNEFTAAYLDYDDEGKNFYEGEAKWYAPNGKIQQKKYYYNNKTNGKETFFYENGQISQETEYDHGIRNGTYKQWYQTGNPKILALYKKGELVDNKYIEYDEGGLGALVYNENFNAHKNAWLINGDGHVSQITRDNKVSLTLNKDISVNRTNYISLDQNSSYSIESIVHKKSGKGTEAYGILFGFKDWSNYYSFLISEYGSYTIVGEFEGVKIKLSDWKASSAINIGNKRNLLKVMKINDEFFFYINGEEVERTKSKSLRGNYFGILAGGKGEFILENILIKEFLRADDTADKSPKNKDSDDEDWKGNGSGFFINEKGYIATNYHVVEDAEEIQVEYFQRGIKQIYKAKVVVSDKQNDLSILQIVDPDFINLPRIPYVFSSTTKDVGTDVFALGYPMAHVMGTEIKFTDGKISSKTGIQGDITVYQISVPIQSGNSGGPLFDSKGNLVGITSSSLNKEYFESENVNYAIKTSYLKNLIDVMPESISLPNYTDIHSQPLTEKIKLLSDFIPLIRIK